MLTGEGHGQDYPYSLGSPTLICDAVEDDNNHYYDYVIIIMIIIMTRQRLENEIGHLGSQGGGSPRPGQGGQVS